MCSGAVAKLAGLLESQAALGHRQSEVSTCNALRSIVEVLFFAFIIQDSASRCLTRQRQSISQPLYYLSILLQSKSEGSKRISSLYGTVLLLKIYLLSVTGVHCPTSRLESPVIALLVQSPCLEIRSSIPKRISCPLSNSTAAIRRVHLFNDGGTGAFQASHLRWNAQLATPAPARLRYPNPSRQIRDRGFCARTIPRDPLPYCGADGQTILGYYTGLEAEAATMDVFVCFCVGLNVTQNRPSFKH